MGIWTNGQTDTGQTNGRTDETARSTTTKELIFLIDNFLSAAQGNEDSKNALSFDVR